MDKDRNLNSLVQLGSHEAAHTFLLFLAAMAIVAALDLEDYNKDMDMQSQVTVPENQEQEAASLRGVGRFLSQYQTSQNDLQQVSSEKLNILGRTNHTTT
ncbi:hypothetical protein CFP56_000372 [Quercus suber]|uniref:Uncharacterized protein n=1 Tax=Quercus suber TaxID=58331 RepID=A0AAW0M921_QUESU